MKHQRQQAILRIISEEAVQTQEVLLTRLNESGYAVTQATVSRDIRELNLVKAASSAGYKYVIAGQRVDEQESPKLNRALAESVLSVDFAQNLIVVKTHSGMAGAVATCIDSFRSPDVIGCVAGDDAILVVTRDLTKTEEICRNMKEKLGITNAES